MTEELKHISKFLIKLVKNNFHEFSEYALTNPDTNKLFSKTGLINKLKGDAEIVEWLFLDGLSWNFGYNNYLDTLVVFKDDGYEFTIYQVDNKLIKSYMVGVDVKFKFVNKIIKTIEIEVYE
jgi:hypothetical protein